LLHNQSTTFAKVLRTRCAITVQSLRERSANRSANALQSFEFAPLRSLLEHFAFAAQTLRNRFEVTLQSLKSCDHTEIAKRW
jgi:hypothetical protein